VKAQRYSTGFYLAVAANILFFASMQWTYATLPGYIQSIGGSLMQIGLATALFSLSAVVSRPAIGRLADRWGRRPLLIGGAAIFAAAPVLYLALPSLWPFMVVRLVHGLGIAAFTTAFAAAIADLVAAERRGEALGLSGASSNLGLLFMPALGAAVVALWGYGAHFGIAAGLAAASVLLSYALRTPHESTFTPADTPSLLSVARRRPVWVAAISSTGLALVYGAALSFVAPLAAERNLSTAGLYFSALAVAILVAQSAAGWLSDRVGRRAVAAPGLALAALAAAALASVHTDAALIAAGAGLGLSWGLVRAGLDAGVVDAVPDRARGSALGLLYTCFDAGIGVGAFGLGIVAQAWGYAPAFHVAAAWALVTFVLYTALK
jgi:MFS family permease